MSDTRRIPVLASGFDQVLTIPHEFAFSTKEVLLRKEGQRLIIEPIPTESLLSLLAKLPDIAEDFANMDDTTLPPLDDINL